MMDYLAERLSTICTLETLSDPGSRQAIEDWLTSLRPDSPASPSLGPGCNLEGKMNGTAGRIPLQSFASFSLATSSWRTYQLSFLPDTSDRSSVTWPRAGMIAAGIAYRHQPLAPITRGIGSGLSGGYPTPVCNDTQQRFNTSPYLGAKPRPNLAAMAKFNLWPTPMASDGSHGGPNQRDSSGRPALSMAVRIWPTPTVTNASYTSEASKEKYGSGMTLIEAVRWATPTTRDWRSGKASEETHSYNSRPLSEQVGKAESGGQLNPTWVEWLMGWPLGWGDLKPLGTDRFRQWLQQHGDY